MELDCWKLGGEVTQQVELRGDGREKADFDFERKREKCLRRKTEQEEEADMQKA